jgi:DsbC/DsbD-like thiol-disulfide interchange protein
VTLTAGDPAKPIRLSLAFEYGICKDICVPAEAKLDLELPAAGPADMPRSLAQALDSVPRKAAVRKPGDPELRTSIARLTGDKPVIVIEGAFAPGATGADAFIEAPEGIYVPLPKRTAEGKDGRITFEVDLTQGADPTGLKGKTLTITLVSAAGHSETQWTVD